MKCLMCGDKGYYKVNFLDSFFFKNCDCEMVKNTIANAKKQLDFLKKEEIDESKYTMDAAMIMSIATLFLEMQDYDSMMEYASLLHGVDLGN